MAGHNKKRTSPALLVCSSRNFQSRHFRHVIVCYENIYLMNMFQGFLGRGKDQDEMAL